MKKTILNLGKTLTKAEQKNVFGGNLISWGNEPFEECTGPEGDFPCIMANPNYDPNSPHLINNPMYVTGVCRDGHCFYQ